MSCFSRDPRSIPRKTHKLPNLYHLSPLRLGAESGPEGAPGTPGPAPGEWLVGPKQLRHSPLRGPAALAIALAGDMLPANDSVDRDWG